ncbi:MAG: TrkH family potassium uptake protein [Erysipelotrichaceae bacterium]
MSISRNKLSSLNNYGKLTILIGIILFVPVFCIIFYPQDFKYVHCFLIPSVLSILFGLILCFFGKRFIPSPYYTVNLRNSTLIVLYAWVYSCLAGALPFMLSGQLNFIQALFEAVSGFTTCGLSVIDVDNCFATMLFYRSWIQFVGGLGFVLLFLIVVNDRQSMDLFNAEGHPEKIRPNLRVTARTLFKTYLIMTGFGVVGYCLLGMGFFDSLNTTMTAVSTGGFATHSDGVASFSNAIKLWTTLLMLMGGINMAVLILPTKGKFKEMFKNTEFKVLNSIVIGFTAIVMLITYNTSDLSLFDNFVDSIFNVVSSLTTTGDYMSSFIGIPHAKLLLYIILMVFGGSVGSTAGGLKLSRVYISIKVWIKSITDRMRSSRSIKYIHMYTSNGDCVISDKQQKDAVNYVGIYLLLLLAGTFGLMLTANCQLHEALFEFTSCLSTVGSSVGITAADATVGTFIIEIIGMLLGRLEIIPLVFGLIYAGEGIKKLFRKV